MYAFWLAFFGSVCWGLAPIFGKVGLRGIPTIDGLAARTLITILLVGLWVLISGNIARISEISTKSWFFLGLEAFFATFAGDLAYYAAIKRGDIGQTAIVLASSPFISVFAGSFFLGETLTMMKLAGAALIVLGVVLIGFDAMG
ncbi:EamA family transporter [Heliobacterium gestii]|uniref:EamA family transporter n=1 Tax=Heliomicrobium gestii TaxID=2699 RepID=A0A845LFV0_HELGE|nr:EamA family transporter [Heliomicrobium gestii]MBM7865474.1 transporter family protein [Heliomicrobium gestii]MZP41726.1 EamA family transporter [Heliomicrobium gestii]